MGHLPAGLHHRPRLLHGQRSSGRGKILLEEFRSRLSLGETRRCATRSQERLIYRPAAATSLSGSAFDSPAIAGYTTPAIAAPTIGANQNSQSCCTAQSPTKIAGAVLRAGFTERFVTGIPMRWIKVRPRPIATGANPAGARLSVAPMMIIRNMNVRTTSAVRQATRE